MSYIKDYIKKNEPQMMEDLFSLLRIPSISAKPEHKDVITEFCHCECSVVMINHSQPV